MRFEGKAALVTGAGSGIGRATARLLAKEGATVGVVDVERERAEDAAAELGDAGLALPVDITDVDAVDAAVRALVDRAGRLDLVVANAGINGVWAPIDELEPEEWDRTMAVNLRGTFLTIRQSVPHMKRQGGGAIVVTSSVQGTTVFSNSGGTAYGCTKAALLAFVKVAAPELGPHGIRINAVCPGAVSTNIGENTEQRHTQDLGLPVEYPEGVQPLRNGGGGILEPDQVARAVAFLLSDDADGVTGSPLWVDGGQSTVVG